MVRRKIFLILQVVIASASNTIKTKSNKSSRTIEPNQEFFKVDIDNDIENEININYLNNPQKDTFQMETKRENNNEDQLEDFTHFIQAVINRLIQLDDSKLQQFFTVINDEARKYHYKGCKFYELIHNHGFRKFLGRTLAELKTLPPVDIRNTLEVVAFKLKNNMFEKKEKEIINMLKALYDKDSLKKFKDFLNNIEAYDKNTRKNININVIVKSGLRSLVFDHYSQLNSNARTAFKSALNGYWNHVEEMSTYEPNVTPPKLKPLRINLNIQSDSNGSTKSQVADQRKSFLYPIAPLTPKYDDLNKMAKIHKQIYNYHNTERTVMMYPQSTMHFNNKGPYNYELNFKYAKAPLQADGDLDAYEYLTSTRKKVKWLTFKTLYPEFEAKWQTMAKTNPYIAMSPKAPYARFDFRKSFQNVPVITEDPLSQQLRQVNNIVFQNISNNNSIVDEDKTCNNKNGSESIQNLDNEQDNLNTQVKNYTEMIDFELKDSRTESNKLNDSQSNYTVTVTEKSTDMQDRDIEYDTKVSNIDIQTNNKEDNEETTSQL